MVEPSAIQPPNDRRERGSAFPWFGRVGLVGIAFGVVLELVALASSGPAASPTPANPAVHAHLGHLDVLIGMVLVMAGVVVRRPRAQGRTNRPERSGSNAVR